MRTQREAKSEHLALANLGLKCQCPLSPPAETMRLSVFMSQTAVHFQVGEQSGSGRALVLLSLAELLAMSLWFTGTAVLPQVTPLWHAGLSLTSWLTIAVRIGFAVGALSFALFNVPDVF